MSHLKILRRRSGPVDILELDGRITLGAGSTELRNTVAELADGGSTRILLDLGRVSYMDSSGLGELVSAFARLQRQGGELKLVNLAARVHGLLETTKLATVFESFDNEPDALRSFEFSRTTSPGA